MHFSQIIGMRSDQIIESKKALSEVVGFKLKNKIKSLDKFTFIKRFVFFVGFKF